MPPFRPPNEDNFSQKVVNDGFRDENDEKFKESLLLLDKPKIQQLFSGYYFDYVQMEAFGKTGQTTGLV